MSKTRICAGGHRTRGRPLFLPQLGFGSREWSDVACDIAHMGPRVLLESAAPRALVALAANNAEGGFATLQLFRELVGHFLVVLQRRKGFGGPGL
jgi:hypothetical protein